MTATPTWTLDEVAVATGGEIHGDGTVRMSGVSIDSRAVAAGSLFVAVTGENHDGHHYAADALRAGASAALVAANARLDVEPRVVVPDTVTALRDLAVLRRSELDIPVVAVTGSTGKTSTKDILRSVLPGSWASPASFNNEIGVPLTVLSTPPDARYLVTEVGARSKGNISWLAGAVRPSVAIITNLGVVHLETFGTPERLLAAKWELIEALDSKGTAVLPVAETRFPPLEGARTLTFGDGPEADVWYSDLTVDPAARPRFTLWYDGAPLEVRMAMAGGHQAVNATAAAAAALALGIDAAEVLGGLEAAEASPGRMEIHGGAVTVVNDAYNANPDSMEAALRTVAGLPGRHVAVLGRMAELGTEEEQEHARIGALARRLGFAAVVVVGADPGLAAAAGPVARRVEDEDEALAVLGGFLRDGDVVLVKASNVVGLQGLARRLAEGAIA